MNTIVKLVARYRPDRGEANLFGIVLYDDEHPVIAKVLRDEDFRRAIDKVSGPRWVVFVADPPPSRPSNAAALYRLAVISRNVLTPTQLLLEPLGLPTDTVLPGVAIYATDGNAVRSKYVRLTART